MNTLHKTSRILGVAFLLQFVTSFTRGLITVLPLLLGTLLAIFDYQIPFFMALPYVPFELVIGFWLLVKGIPQDEVVVEAQPLPAHALS